MSSTPPTSPARASGGVRASILNLALILALLGAVAVAGAPIVGVVNGPGASGPILGASIFAALCALVIPVRAVGTARRNPALSGALLAGAGAVSVGVAILDVQVFADAIDANRLEFFRPISAGVIDAGAGASVVLLGHGLSVIAGVLGIVAIHRESERDGYGSAHVAEHHDRSVGGRIGTGPTTVLIVAAGVYVLSSFGPAFDSQDPIFLVRTLVDGPAASAIGTAVVAVAVLIVTASALTSISPWVGAGALVGMGVGALGSSGTRVVAGLASDDRIGVGAGSLVGACAAVVLVGVGAAVPLLSSRRESRVAEAAIPASAHSVSRSKGARKAEMIAQAHAAQARVTKLHRLAGAFGVITAALAAVAAMLPVLNLPEGLPEPSFAAIRIVAVAAAVLLVVSLGLFVPGRAATIRPVLGPLWTVVPFASAAVLQPAVIATDISGVGLGSGVFVLGAASVVAVATGLVSWLAGTAEREDIDTSVELETNFTVSVLAGVGGALVLVGAALPLYRGEGHNAASITQWPWGIDIWGQLLLGTAVVVACLIAARSRPVRAVALLVGSALSTAVYLVMWPLTSSRIPDATVGAGAIAAATGLLLITVAVFSCVATAPSTRATRQ